VKLRAATSKRSAALRKVYREFDINRDGSVGEDELMALGQARRKLGQKSGGWSAEQNRRLLSKMRVDDGGNVAEKDFVKHFEEALPKDEAEFDAVVEQFMRCAGSVRVPAQEQQDTGLGGPQPAVSEPAVVSVVRDADVRSNIVREPAVPAEGTTANSPTSTTSIAASPPAQRPPSASAPRDPGTALEKRNLDRPSTATSPSRGPSSPDTPTAAGKRRSSLSGVAASPSWGSMSPEELVSIAEKAVRLEEEQRQAREERLALASEQAQARLEREQLKMQLQQASEERTRLKLEQQQARADRAALAKRLQDANEAHEFLDALEHPESEGQQLQVEGQEEQEERRVQGTTKQEQEKLFAAMDLNGDGVIDHEEFAAALDGGLLQTRLQEQEQEQDRQPGLEAEVAHMEQ